MKRIAAPIAEDVSLLAFAIRRIERESMWLLDVLERHLEGRDWL